MSIEQPNKQAANGGNVQRNTKSKKNRGGQKQVSFKNEEQEGINAGVLGGSTNLPPSGNSKRSRGPS